MKTYIEKRPWGIFEEFTKNKKSTIKILTIEPNQELSLQFHENRWEFWKVLSGNPLIQIGDEKIESKPEDSFVIPQKEKHRVTANREQVKILEISFGDFDENDIVRLEDRYNR